MESKEDQSHVCLAEHMSSNDMGQIRGENFGNEVCSDKNQTDFRFV